MSDDVPDELAKLNDIFLNGRTGIRDISTLEDLAKLGLKYSEIQSIKHDVADIVFDSQRAQAINRIESIMKGARDGDKIILPVGESVLMAHKGVVYIVPTSQLGVAHKPVAVHLGHASWLVAHPSGASNEEDTVLITAMANWIASGNGAYINVRLYPTRELLGVHELEYRWSELEGALKYHPVTQSPASGHKEIFKQQIRDLKVEVAAKKEANGIVTHADLIGKLDNYIQNGSKPRRRDLEHAIDRLRILKMYVKDYESTLELLMMCSQKPAAEDETNNQ
jgi:hypothetical protein